MSTNNIAVIGVGYVGKGMLKIFPDAIQYDEPQGIGTQGEVNECDMAIVCVPTPMLEDKSCDTSIVEEVVSWLETPLILIKSALEPGTADRLKEEYDKRIVVSPEYMGESHYWMPPKYPDPKNPISHGFVILGGEDKDCSVVADLMIPILGPATRFRFVSCLEAEVIKYAENTWGAMKVTFANELREICEALGANWHKVREGWLDDPRVEPMHTAVFKNKKGYGGKCFPKDTWAFYRVAQKNGYDPMLLQAMLIKNGQYENSDFGQQGVHRIAPARED